MSRAACSMVIVFAALLPAAAQDLGAQWVDRVTKELQAEKLPPGQGSQLTYGAQGGVLFVYDSNVFLTENNKIGDQIWVPFARANVDYAEPQWGISAALDVDYRYYVETQDARDDDERFILRAGFAGPVIGANLIQMLRHESDPIDATFADRTERFVSDTIPRIWVDITPVIAVELDGHIQIVRYEETVFADARDNENYRIALTLAYKSQVGIDFLLMGGTYFVHYNDDRDALGDPTAPPDVTTWFAMGGFRGDVRPDLYVEALIGIESAQSEDFELITVPARDGRELNTMCAQMVARYKVIDRVTASASYTRRVVFGGGQDPYQVVDRILLLADYQATEQLTLRARVQVDLVNSVLGVDRTYTSVGLIADYKVMDHVLVDGGVTARFGHLSGDVAFDQNYNDVILQLGVVLAW